MALTILFFCIGNIRKKVQREAGLFFGLSTPYAVHREYYLVYLSLRRFALRQTNSVAQPSKIVTYTTELSPVCGLPEDAADEVFVGVFLVPFLELSDFVAEVDSVLVSVAESDPVSTVSVVLVFVSKLSSSVVGLESVVSESFAEPSAVAIVVVLDSFA